MDLSIIIAHYDPGNHPKCIDSFQRTLHSIIEQKESYNIEIIIADDGSFSNKKLVDFIRQIIRTIYNGSFKKEYKLMLEYIDPYLAY